MHEIICAIFLGGAGLALWMFKDRKLRLLVDFAVGVSLEPEKEVVRVYDAKPRDSQMTIVREERMACLLWLKLVQKNLVKKRTSAILTDDIIRHIVSTYFATPNYTHIATLTAYDDGVNCMHVHENKLYSGGDDSVIRVSNADSFEYITSFEASRDASAPLQPELGIWCMLVHNNKLFCGGGDDPTRVWDTRTHQQVGVLAGQIGVLCMLVCGDTLYSGSENSSICAWDIDTHETIALLEGHTRGVQCLLSDVPSRLLYSGSCDFSIGVWSLDTHEPLTFLRGHCGEVASILLHQGQLVTGGGDKEIRIWKAGEGATLLSEAKEPTLVATLHMSANRRTCVDMANPNRLVRVCLRGKKQDVRCMIGYQQKLFTGGEDCGVLVWDLDSYELYDALEGHTGSITCMLLHEGMLYSGSTDRSVRVWDADTLECVAVLPGHIGRVNCLTIYENKLYSGSAGGWSNAIRVHQCQRK